MKHSLINEERERIKILRREAPFTAEGNRESGMLARLRPKDQEEQAGEVGKL